MYHLILHYHPFCIDKCSCTSVFSASKAILIRCHSYTVFYPLPLWWMIISRVVLQTRPRLWVNFLVWFGFLIFFSHFSRVLFSTVSLYSVWLHQHDWGDGGLHKRSRKRKKKVWRLLKATFVITWHISVSLLSFLQGEGVQCHSSDATAPF